VNETFTQIIFPPLPKKEYPNSRMRYDINNNPMPPNPVELGTQEYFLQFYDDRIEFMCKCPECGTQYCYSTMKPDTDTDELIKNIKQLHSFYSQEFEYFCPDNATHDIRYERSKRKIQGWEEYEEDTWNLCSLR